MSTDYAAALAGLSLDELSAMAAAVIKLVLQNIDASIRRQEQHGTPNVTSTAVCIRLIETTAAHNTLGVVEGNWAAHPIPNSALWTVTYVPAARNITHNLKGITAKKAVSLIHELHLRIPSFSDPDKPTYNEICAFWEVIRFPSALDIFADKEEPQ